MKTTRNQDAVVAMLAKRGFVVNSVTAYDGEIAPTVFMSKQVKHSTRYAEVGPDALINGRLDAQSEINWLLK